MALSTIGDSGCAIFIFTTEELIFRVYGNGKSATIYDGLSLSVKLRQRSEVGPMEETMLVLASEILSVN
jgi:hypothetical protein